VSQEQVNKIVARRGSSSPANTKLQVTKHRHNYVFTECGKQNKKTLALNGQEPIRANSFADGKPIENVTKFHYVTYARCTLRYLGRIGRKWQKES
jgi:hypothetical protein